MFDIRIENLSKTYKQKNCPHIRAVDNLNLHIEPGQLIGFLGPNGAGKTTTIKMICSLVKPTSGHVYIGQYDVWYKRGLTMPLIGAVLEGTRNVHWPLSAWDNLIYFGHLKGIHGKALSVRSEQMLRELDLWDRRNDLVRSFSRGMQQKVAIACALVADPPIVLLDEPTLGLDVQAARVVKDMVRHLVKDLGKTVVLTTHQLDVAQVLCDRVAIIRKGQLIADQPVQQLLDLFRSEYYEFRLEGSLSSIQGLFLDNLGMKEENGVTVLTGPVKGQEELFAYIDQLRGTGLPLISVSRSEPDLEEVFVRLLDSQDGMEFSQ